jgi:CRP/FNR family cyclic AMP-dependent transcriptional regulator
LERHGFEVRRAELVDRMTPLEEGENGIRRLTHATIGQMVGASRETVSRTMRSLVNRQIVRVSRKEILLLDREALRLAAQRG